MRVDNSNTESNTESNFASNIELVYGIKLGGQR